MIFDFIIHYCGLVPTGSTWIIYFFSCMILLSLIWFFMYLFIRLINLIGGKR